MDILILFIVCISFLLLGFNLGWHAREKAAQRVVNKFIDEMQSIEQQEADTINISIEKHNDTYYVYDKDENSFMGQATNRKELESVLASRFPGKRFMADKDNMKEVGFK